MQNDSILEKYGENLTANKYLVNPAVARDNELKEAIERSIKDFKATLFINNLIVNEIDKNYEIIKIELEQNEE